MRDTLVKQITNLAEKNKKIVVLAGDIGYKLFDEHFIFVFIIMSSHFFIHSKVDWGNGYT